MKKLDIKSLGELLAREYPPQRWLTDGLVPCDGLVMMSSAPANYKTWLMMQFAISVAKGEKLFDHFSTEQSGVLVVDEESGERALQERFKRLGANEDLPIYYLSRLGRKATKDYIDNIIEICQEKGIGLVMFDSLIRFHSGNENDSVEMAQVMNEFKKISDAGIACLILHHNRKSSLLGSNMGESMRGSGDLLAACDIHIAIARKKNVVTISQSKNRYCEEMMPIKVKFVSVDEKSWFEFSEYQKSKDEKMDEMKRVVFATIAEFAGINRSELMRRFKQSSLDMPVNKVNDLLKSLLEDGDIYTERGEKNAVKYFVKND